MAEIPVQLRGTLYDLMTKSARQVFFDGVAWRSDVGIGGGPVFPPSGGGGPVDPGYGYPERPVDPGWGVPERPPHIWGPNDPRPQPPIYIPPNVPPSLQPPNPPHPGDPVTPVPPPEGSPGWPVQPIQPPPYIVVSYPGIGPVTVPQPLTAQPKG